MFVKIDHGTVIAFTMWCFVTVFSYVLVFTELLAESFIHNTEKATQFMTFKKVNSLFNTQLGAGACVLEIQGYLYRFIIIWF